jgi:hypothetical protein
LQLNLLFLPCSDWYHAQALLGCIGVAGVVPFESPMLLSAGFFYALSPSSLLFRLAVLHTATFWFQIAIGLHHSCYISAENGNQTVCFGSNSLSNQYGQLDAPQGKDFLFVTLTAGAYTTFVPFSVVRSISNNLRFLFTAVVSRPTSLRLAGVSPSTTRPTPCLFSET